MLRSSSIVIAPRAPKTEALRIMNEAQGEKYWSVSSSCRWLNLIAARTIFVRARLVIEGMSIREYKELPKAHKRFMMHKIEEAFTSDDGFFRFTRDEYWMQDAVGDKDCWIGLGGMARWHVTLALASLESNSENLVMPAASAAQNQSVESASSQEPFDPVRDSARENLGILARECLDLV